MFQSLNLRQSWSGNGRIEAFALSSARSAGHQQRAAMFGAWESPTSVLSWHDLGLDD
jgi:hypothetical protein